MTEVTTSCSLSLRRLPEAGAASSTSASTEVGNFPRECTTSATASASTAVSATGQVATTSTTAAGDSPATTRDAGRTDEELAQKAAESMIPATSIWRPLG